MRGRYFSKSIAKLVPENGCISGICLPQLVDYKLAELIVEEINNIHTSAEAKAVHIVTDPRAKFPQVFHGSALDFRSGSHCMVWVDKEFMPDSGFLSVVKSLIPEGFPAGSKTHLQIQDIVSSFIDVIKQESGIKEKLPPDGFSRLEESLLSVFLFYRDSFEEVGNSLLQWDPAWWRCAIPLLGNIAEHIRNNAAISDPVKMCYSLAGLPIPLNGDTGYTRLNYKLYAKIIHQNFNTADSAEESVKWAAEALGKVGLKDLDFTKYAAHLAKEGHPASALSLFSENDIPRKIKAWEQINEEDFERIADINRRKGFVKVFKDSKELPLSQNQIYILPTENAVLHDDGKISTFEFQKVEILVPWKEGILTGANLAPPSISEIRIAQKKKNLWDITLSSARCTPQGLAIEANIVFKIKNNSGWPDEVFIFEIELVRVLSGYLNTVPKCRLILPAKGELSFIVSMGTKTAKTLIFEMDEDVEHISLEKEQLLQVISYHSPGTSADGKFTCGNLSSKEWEQASWVGFNIVEKVNGVDGLTIDKAGLSQKVAELSIKQKTDSPLLPLAATLLKTHPSQDSLPPSALKAIMGLLEDYWMETLSKLPTTDESSCLYCILPLEVEHDTAAKLVPGGKLVKWLGKPKNGSSLEIASVGSEPPEDLIQTPEFKEMLESLTGIIKHLEKSNSGGAEVWASRWHLRDLPQEKMDRYLISYKMLVSKAKEKGPLALFWASYPFSAIIYDAEDSNVKNILLSPLHPVRLGWLYGAEQASKEFVLNGSSSLPIASQIIEGWNFPYVGPAPSFDSHGMLVAIPIDSGPSQIFMGWSALSYFDQQNGSQPKIPAMAAGYKMPGGGSSGLNQGGVGAAIRDYLRVYPHLPTLTIDLFASHQIPRSSDLDNAIWTELSKVSKEDSSVNMPLALVVKDSTNRKGVPPTQDEVLEMFGRQGRVPSFEWSFYDSTHARGVSSDIRFVEDAQARISCARSDGQPLGTASKWPIKRFVCRQTVNGPDGAYATLIQYRISPQEHAWRTYAEALDAIETLPFDTGDALRVKPEPTILGTGTGATAKWVVTGNVFTEPASVSRMLAKMSNSLLWEWRPPFLPRSSGGGNLDFGRRPYVTIANIPATLTDKISKMHSLNKERAKLMISELGRRGIGLASLLSMGGNHAEGALGFYFGFKMALYACEKDSIEGQRGAYVVPLDAINPMLNAILGNSDSRTSRADILTVQIEEKDNEFIVNFIPVEIRCSGFTTTDPGAVFPKADSTEVKGKTTQLESTFKVLSDVISVLEKNQNCILKSAMASVIETAFLLSDKQAPGYHELEYRCLNAILNGKVTYRVPNDVLFWFQANSTNGPHRIDTIPAGTTRMALFLDPIAFQNDPWEKAEKIGELAGEVIFPAIKPVLPKIPKPTLEEASKPIEVVVPPGNETPVTTPLQDPIAHTRNIDIFLGTSQEYRDGIFWRPFLASRKLKNPHTVILGGSGSGKTQTILALLLELHKSNVPSLVLDFRDDYVQPERLASIGAKLYDVASEGLPINPLYLYPDPINKRVNPVSQVYEISGILRTVYGLGPIQEAGLKNALYRCYESVGIPKKATEIKDDQVMPTFDSLRVEIEKSDDVNLRNRLSSIFDLEIFRESGQGMENLFTSSTVVRFTGLPSEEVKKATAGIMLHSLYSSILRKKQMPDQLRLVLVIDEAHRIANLDPVKNLFKEIRPYGVGVFLSTQEGRDLQDFVFSNAGSLLIFNLQETSDADRVAKLLSGGGSNYKDISEKLRSLKMFEALFRNEHYTPFAEVKIKPYHERVKA